MSEFNPPAFPSWGEHRDEHGMELRDYFAAAALPAVFNQAEAEAAPAWPDFAAAIAKTCYGLADAMLKERAK